MCHVLISPRQAHIRNSSIGPKTEPRCAAGFCIYGPQALIGIAAANQATKKAAATANGLTGLFGYASTLVSGVGLGFVAQHYGWNWAYVGILGMAVVGMLVFLLMWGAKADGYEPEAE